MSDQINCPRYEECARRDEEMRHMVEKIGDEKREDHKELWAAIEQTNKTVNNLAVAVGSMTGRMIGYLSAGTLVVGIVTFLAAKVIK